MNQLRLKSQVITFLDRFEKENWTWNLKKANFYELNFYKVVEKSVKNTLKQYNIEIIENENILKLLQEPLKIKSVIKELEKDLNEYEYDYKSIVNLMYQESLKVILELCPYIKKSDFNDIYTTEIVPFNEEWSTFIDISFQAGGDHGNQIAFPNANKFNKEHIKAWNQMTKYPNRHKRDYYFRCFTAICHEIIHCIQVKLKQIDNDPLSWSAEHDASYLANSLLYYISYNELHDSTGLFEEILVLCVDDTLHQMEKFEKSNEDYQKWVDSFGLISPSKEVVVDGVATYFKMRISIEATVYQKEDLIDQLDNCFKDRTGNVHELKKEFKKVKMTNLFEIKNQENLKVKE